MEIVDLTYESATVRILTDVSAEIPEGSITALVGRNGAGKTTLLRCLGGDLPPSAGRVTVGGVDVDLASDQWKRSMGFVPDDDELFEELTVEEHLTFAATLFGVKREAIAGRVTVLLDLSGLAPRSSSLARELSAGMRKRLAIALALVHSPRVLLFDEPLDSLDYDGGETFLQTLRYLRSLGRTALISGHSLPSLIAVADRIVEMDGGRIVNTLDLPAGKAAPEGVLPMLKSVSSAAGAPQGAICLPWMEE